MDHDLVKSFAETTREAIKQATAPLHKRIEALETQLTSMPIPKDGAPGEKGEPGERGEPGAPAESVDIDQIAHKAASLIEPPKNGAPGADGRDGKDGANGRDGLDGKDCDMDEVRATLSEMKRDALEYIKAIPLPKDGKDGADGKDGMHGKNGADGLDGKDGKNGLDGKDGEPGADGARGSDGIDGKDGADGLNGKDGKDGLHGKDADPIDYDRLKEIIVKEVSKLPAPKDGADGERGPRGASGVGFKSGKITRDGRLLLTKDDGELIDAGVVVGPPGQDGDDGRDATLLEDFELKASGRQVTITLISNGLRHEKSVLVDLPIYQGVFRQGTSYEKGDVIFFRGSSYIAERETRKPPETENAGWKLLAKAGRDGKSVRGEKGEKGDPGRHGKDMTHARINAEGGLE